MPLPADTLRLFSYNHLLLTAKLERLLPTGEGVAGARLMVESPKSELEPRGEGDPKLNLRPFSLLPFATAFWNSGLAVGEKEGPTEVLCPETVPLADRGDVLRLAGLA